MSTVKWMLISNQVDHTKPDTSYVISPPEERRMFLSKVPSPQSSLSSHPYRANIEQVHLHISLYLTYPPYPTFHKPLQAFITFRTFQAATIARQVVHMQLAGHMAISEAPEPTDVTWINMYTTRTGQLYRRFLVEAIVLFLIVIWVRENKITCYFILYGILLPHSVITHH